MSVEPLTQEQRAVLAKLAHSGLGGMTDDAVKGLVNAYEATVQEAEERLKFVAAQWAAEVELERERAERLAEALDDAIQLADEGWAYAGDYFREKWNYVGQADALRAILAVHRPKDER